MATVLLEEQFPNASSNIVGPSKYTAYRFIVSFTAGTRNDDGTIPVKIYGQAVSTGNWDWWVGSGSPHPITVYLNGVEQNSLDLYDLNLPGWGSEGSLDSGVGQIASFNIKKGDKLRVTVDCSSSPVISNSWCPGFWDSGQMDDWPGVVFLTAPTISGSLTNTTPYRNPVDGKTYYNISAYETSVGLKYTKSGGDDEDTYRHWHSGQSEPNSWLDDPSNNSYTESGLSAGTSYTCYCRIHNDAGQSEIASWSGRTLHKIPVVTLSHSHSTQAGLEDLYISWSCDKNVACIYYRVQGESNWRIGAGARSASSDIGRSGTIHISETEGTVEGSKDLYENTDYVIEVKVLSTVAYDSRESSTKSITCKTDRRAALTSSSSRNITIGATLRVLKENESGNRNDIFFATRPYDNSSAYVDWSNRNLADNDETIAFTQTEWDNVYKRFLNPSNASKSLTEHNNIRVRFTLRTYGRTRHYDSTYEGLIILTGDMMTTRTNVRGALKRGKAWCRPNGTIRRGVAWITSSRGVWRRGI